MALRQQYHKHVANQNDPRKQVYKTKVSYILYMWKVGSIFIPITEQCYKFYKMCA